MTLSAAATLIIEKFLPDSHQKYLFLNYKQSGVYRTYKSFIPSYLQDRPRNVISHCLERRTKSLKYILTDVTVVDEGTGKFQVKGSSGKNHTVSFGDPSCTCRDWVEWNMPCKHFFCVFQLYPQWNWNSLPDHYTSSAYLSTDQAALNSYFGADQHAADPDVADQDVVDPDGVDQDVVDPDGADQDVVDPDDADQDVVDPDGANQDVAVEGVGCQGAVADCEDSKPSSSTTGSNEFKEDIPLRKVQCKNV